MTLVTRPPDLAQTSVVPPTSGALPDTPWWLLPGVLMLGVGVVGATRPVLSWDEIATADAARRSVPQIWHLAHHIDGVFAPYYLLMHLWTAVVGDSVLALRLPSILAMAAAV